MERFTMIALIGNILFVIGMLLGAIGLRVDGAVIFGNIISTMITIPVALYALNCAIVGQCSTYAMLYSYMSLGIGVVVLLVGLVWLLMGPPRYIHERASVSYRRAHDHEPEPEPRRRYYDDRK